MTDDTARRDALREALRDVESRHRRGDWTEEGWHANSIDGYECNGCAERWPCSATRLRLAAGPTWRALAAPAAESDDYLPPDEIEAGSRFHHGRHVHPGRWEDCADVTCAGDRAFLAGSLPSTARSR